MQKEIDIVGPYPPPYGGVSIHIKRISAFLRRSNWNVRVFNQYSNEIISEGVFATNNKISWWVDYLFKSKSKLIHFHHYSLVVVFYFIFIRFASQSKIVLTLHNEKIISTSLKSKIFQLVLKLAKFEQVICVSLSVFEKLCSKNIKCMYLPAYVPPDFAAKQILLPSEFEFRVCANVGMLNNSNDIIRYGLDYLFQLAEEYPDIGFDVYIGQLRTSNSVNFLPTLNNVKYFFGLELPLYFSNYCCFLRPNRDDAFGISVQEALDFGLTALASDVCLRPVGASIFITGDYRDFSNKFADLKIIGFKSLTSTRNTTSYHLELVNLYGSLLNET